MSRCRMGSRRFPRALRSGCKAARRLASLGRRTDIRLCTASVAAGGEPAGCSRGREWALAAAEKGTIADVAVSPNGLTLATAMVTPDGNRVDLIIRDLIASGSGSGAAHFYRRRV